MPELPDVTVYCEALAARIAGHVLARVDIVHPFLLRTAVPPIGATEGRRVIGVRRLEGKSHRENPIMVICVKRCGCNLYSGSNGEAESFPQ